MGEGKVAENIKVTLSALLGMLGSPTIFFTSGMNPMSSILSASSDTRYFIMWNPTLPCPTKSMSLPGVATRMSQPELSEDS